MLGADVVVVEALGFFLRQAQHLARALRKLLEPFASVHRHLPRFARCLVAHPHLRLPRLQAGGSDPLPLSGFRLRDHRFRGRPRRPVRRPSLGYGGTSAVTTLASPETVGDRSYRVPVSCPATLCTDIAAVSCFVAVATCRAYLAGMGWVFPLHGDARTLCRVGDEARELLVLQRHLRLEGP